MTVLWYKGLCYSIELCQGLPNSTAVNARVLYKILLGYPRFGRAHAMRPYGLVFWESGVWESDVVLRACSARKPGVLPA